MIRRYVIPYLPDGWEKPDSFVGSGAPGPDGKYSIESDGSEKTAAELGYTTAHAYPTSITDYCPDAPDATHAEAEVLSAQWASEYGVAV